MKRIAFVVASLAVGSALVLGAKAAEPAPPARPMVQIAILLDTSGSMTGLIDQARTQLWNVVNEFVKARKDGKAPAVQVALFEYGKSSLPASEGYVRLILPLTDDLDRVSEELFALKTNGGEEYCGWVIREAVNRLEWSPSRDVYQAIFIAGNEPFSQGPVDFQASCRAAIGRGIVVNTIFCGPNAAGTQTGWLAGATLADGRYLSIDQDQKIADVPTPHDAEIARLGVDLNKTYLPFGRMGMAGMGRQSAQDSNALNSSTGTLVNRSISKANAVYCNDGWDLVDALKNGKCKLDDLKDDDLPEDFRKLDKAGRQARVDAAAKARGEIQTKIAGLTKQREAFLDADRKKQGADTKADTLDQAMVKVVRDQATRRNFTFE